MCDETKIRELYDREFSRVYRIAMAFLKEPHDAEDAVQTVFLKFIQSKPSFSDETCERAWFAKVTRNLCNDILKSKWNRGKTTWDELADRSGSLDDIKPPVAEGTSDSQVIATFGAEPGRSASAQAERARLLELVMALPAEDRELLYLHYYEEMKLREVAELTGINESTLQSRLAAARKRLGELAAEADR